MRCCYPLLGPKETGPGDSAHTLLTFLWFVFLESFVPSFSDHLQAQRQHDSLWAVTPFGAAFQECVTAAPCTLHLAVALHAFGCVEFRSDLVHAYSLWLC